MRGRTFGFQRALDHAGGVVGPLLAFALLSMGTDLRHVFLLSVVPGIAVILLLGFGLPATSPRAVVAQEVTPLAWRTLDLRVRAMIVATGGLALATTPEVFLVLWAQHHGLEIVWVPMMWAAASATKMAVSLPGGYWSDRFGRLRVLIAGWLFRIAVLVALGFTAAGGIAVWVLFLAYSGSLAFTEGTERALIGDFSPTGQRATVFGLYHMSAGLLALPGAVLFGALWQWQGESMAFFAAAGLTALAVSVLLLIAIRPRSRQRR